MNFYKNMLLTSAVLISSSFVAEQAVSMRTSLVKESKSLSRRQLPKHLQTHRFLVDFSKQQRPFSSSRPQNEKFSWNRGALPSRGSRELPTQKEFKPLDDLKFDAGRSMYFYEKKKPASENARRSGKTPTFSSKPSYTDHNMVVFSQKKVENLQNKPKKQPELETSNMVVYNFDIDLSRKKQLLTRQANEVDKEDTELIVSRPDGRTKVFDPFAYPWSVFGYMEMDYGSKVYLGSGVMMNPSYVLTAGHCLYSIEDGVPESITFYPGRNGKAYKWQTMAKSIVVHPAWHKSEEEDSDIGLLRLEKSNIGQETGWVELANAEDEYLYTTDVQVTGYPYDKHQENKEPFMYTMAGPIATVKKNKFYYKINTFGGQSGSGVVSKFDEKTTSPLTCFGVHVTGCREEGNGAVRLNNEKLLVIDSWMQYFSSAD